eukprot:gnl/TRDRNA2_/TRDRNA2_143795_c0_seq1.p1 gnl/TRDRNA2_/TRDRNA2_143795_c0~~gnl/TRDRNA2_/TRDRNA2_143795_c0_seq1.p1  ORF type:complete len:119 (+),score=11.27 gnl/TRDRNA2_/TRDRNA2_143795_c0_seq1:37-357(+)
MAAGPFDGRRPVATPAASTLSRGVEPVSRLRSTSEDRRRPMSAVDRAGMQPAVKVERSQRPGSAGARFGRRYSSERQLPTDLPPRPGACGRPLTQMKPSDGKLLEI